MGDSRRQSSYGIDCSGFVTESAYLAGITDLATPWGDSASGLMGKGVEVDSFDYLRPGDFVPWSSHVVYVAQAPILLDGKTVDSTTLFTLEAQPDSLGNQLGRTRYSGIRTKGYLRNVGAKRRRWGTP